MWYAPIKYTPQVQDYKRNEWTNMAHRHLYLWKHIKTQEDFTYHIGNVLCLFVPIRVRDICVEHGTASRWCELFGMAGTQSRLRFCLGSRTNVSVLRATALYFSSLPCSMSSTSAARRRVTLVASPCWPNPDGWEKRINRQKVNKLSLLYFIRES